MFTHQAVIMSFRYVLEGLTEQELLELDRSHAVANASITRYQRGDSGFELEHFADTSVVDESDEEVTHEPRDERGAAVTMTCLSTPLEVTEGTLREWPLPEPGSDKDTRGDVLVSAAAAAPPAGCSWRARPPSASAAGSCGSPRAARSPPPWRSRCPRRWWAASPRPAGDWVDAGRRPARELVEGADVVLLGPGMNDPRGGVAAAGAVVPRLEPHGRSTRSRLPSSPRTRTGCATSSGRCVLTVNPTELARVLHRDDDE